MTYVTIEREYGSGGTRIARELAKRCQIACYGEEILELASERLDLTPEKIRECEEGTTNSILYSIFMLGQLSSSETDMLADEGKVYVEEQRAILELAKKGSAIFVGHCACEALKHEKHVIKVFIHADRETKRERIREEYGIPEQNIDATERRMNKRRANYYHANTQKKWEDLKNYDVILDSSRLGVEGCVSVLEGLFQRG